MRDLARLLGVAVNAVKEAVDGGRISRRADGWLDLESAAAQFRNTSTGSNNGHGAIPAQHNETTGELLDDGESAGESMASARTRKERALADKAEVEAAKAREEVVSVADARQLWFAAGRTIRERMLALPDAVSGELALSADQAALLRERIAAVLGELPAEAPT
ncbi:MAG: hypothetical protein A2Y38_19290 [Spirochaetes bacterium GWB1_59_5]|nr:MAG: hypothetical protein A2Y38_19290 [Spirochaetes bacterium GWB1_59_5]